MVMDYPELMQASLINKYIKNVWLQGEGGGIY